MVSSSRSADDISDLDRILGAMEKPPLRRSASDALSNALLHEERERKRINASLRTLSETSSAPSCPTPTTACTNCDERDASKFALTADKAELVCGSCGACFRRAAPKSHTFDKTPRADLHFQASTDGSSSRADGIEDAAIRAAVRAQEVESTVVRGQLRATQSGIQKRAAREQMAHQQQLTPHQSLKRDRAIVAVHTTFRECGRNPDTCAVCADASRLVNTIFMRCAAHATICESGGGGPCRYAAIGASTRALAMECIRTSIDRAKTDPDSTVMTTVGGTFAIEKVAEELSAPLQRYTSQRNVSSAVAKVVSAVVCASPSELSKPCASTAAAAIDAAASSAHHPSSSIDTQRLALSVTSLSTIGWASDAAVERTLAFLATPTCCVWLANVSSWPADVVAIMLVSCFSEDGFETKLASRLKTVSKQHAINHASAKAQLSSLQDMLRIDGMLTASAPPLPLPSSSPSPSPSAAAFGGAVNTASTAAIGSSWI